jgi:hypothetical protein
MGDDRVAPKLVSGVDAGRAGMSEDIRAPVGPTEVLDDAGCANGCPNGWSCGVIWKGECACAVETCGVSVRSPGLNAAIPVVCGMNMLCLKGFTPVA